jgi:hypothetical protein
MRKQHSMNYIEEIVAECNTTGTNDRIDSDFVSPILFDGCTWDNPTPKAEGGGIYLSRSSATNEVISIIRCSFNNINLGTSYSSGGFYIYDIKSVNISSSSFKSLLSVEYGAGYLYSISTCVLFHDCKCVDCVASLADVGGLILFYDSCFIDDADDCVSVSSRAVIFSSSFIKCKSTSYSCGGIYISASSTPTIRSCIFDSCSAGMDGGEIYLYISNSDAAKDQILFSCFFQGKYMWKFLLWM